MILHAREVRETERECLSLCVRVGVVCERRREIRCVCVCERQKEGEEEIERECVHVCVRKRDREGV